MLNDNIMKVFQEIAENSNLSDETIDLLADLLNDLADGKLDASRINDKMDQIFKNL